MLDEVVVGAPIRADVRDHLVHRVALVVAREHHCLLDLHLAGELVLFALALHEHELGQDLDDGVAGEHVVPHVVRRVVARAVVDGVAGTLVDILAAATVERDEAR